MNVFFFDLRHVQLAAGLGRPTPLSRHDAPTRFRHPTVKRCSFISSETN
jgi:hypothetical protein